MCVHACSAQTYISKVNLKTYLACKNESYFKLSCAEKTKHTHTHVKDEKKRLKYLQDVDLYCQCVLSSALLLRQHLAFIDFCTSEAVKNAFCFVSNVLSSFFVKLSD